MRQAPPLDTPAVRSVLARVHAADPLMTWIFPRDDTRLEATAAWWGLFVEPAVAAGAVDLLDAGPVGGTGPRLGATPVDQGVAAVAVWRFPGDPAAQPGALPTVAGLVGAPVGAQHSRTVGAGQAGLRPLSPSTPSACPQFLAVDPLRQRRGLGRAVRAPGLERSASRGLGVHLGTAEPGALRFYDVLGSHTCARSTCPAGATAVVLDVPASAQREDGVPLAVPVAGCRRGHAAWSGGLAVSGSRARAVARRGRPGRCRGTRPGARAGPAG